MSMGGNVVTFGRPVVGLLTLSLLGVGCTNAYMAHTRFTPTGLAPKDAITVIMYRKATWEYEYTATLEKKVAGCIRDFLENTHPTVRIVPPEKFRQAAFPGLPPEEIPPGDSTWDQLVDDPAYRERIAPLGLHYLIAVSGGTTDDRKFITWETTQSGKRRSQLHATVLDLKQGGKAGYFWVSASNVTFVSATETRACRELGEGVAKFLAGKKLPEKKLPEEEGIWPAMREEGAEPAVKE